MALGHLMLLGKLSKYKIISIKIKSIKPLLVYL